MTKEEARDEIRSAAQNCEETAIGDAPLSEPDLAFLEEQARRLLAALGAYRAGSAGP